ncbi:HD domain-containing protein, partial [Desulfovibrio sp. OttesenSCG-928-F07]|nr:HD domain-containing protein [Desulfovibrio sp. OttesenSCG-928-F07]
HAELSAEILADTRFMQQETPEMRSLVRSAIRLHNLKELPPALPEALQLVAQAVRDADKIDIINVMTAELAPGKKVDLTVTMGLTDTPNTYSKEALNAVLNKQDLSYSDMKCVNDFRLMLCTWVYALNFESSKSLLAQRGYMTEILKGLPNTPEIDLVKAQITEELAKV